MKLDFQIAILPIHGTNDTSSQPCTQLIRIPRQTSALYEISVNRKRPTTITHTNIILLSIMRFFLMRIKCTKFYETTFAIVGRDKVNNNNIRNYYGAQLQKGYCGRNKRKVRNVHAGRYINAVCIFHAAYVNTKIFLSGYFLIRTMSTNVA